ARAARLRRSIVQEFRREVGAVRPLERFVDAERGKVSRISQGLEDDSVQLVRQIDLSFEPVVEPQPDAVDAEVSSFFDADDHRDPSLAAASFGAGCASLRSFEPGYPEG